MKILFWATTFQADIQALACHLSNQPDMEVVVALKDPVLYKKQPIEQFLPFKGALIKRDTLSAWWKLVRFNPDILVVDNHLPAYYIPKRILVLWHGYGWRLDHPIRMRRNMSRRVGEVTRSNKRFRWQTIGPFDTQNTIEYRQIHQDNVMQLGAPVSDLLRPDNPLQRHITPENVAAAYPEIDIVNRPTVLIGMTWHYGGLLGHWGEEWELLAKLLDHIDQQGGNTILRMHDKMRYPQAYLDAVTEFCARRKGVSLKFKCESPDSLVDIMISKILITNYSSLANLFYYTLKPSILIVPPEAGKGLIMRQWSHKGLFDEPVVDPDKFWKFDHTDTGSLRAHHFEQLLDHIDTALKEPDCCAAKAADYNSRHIEKIDGHACERTEKMLRQWVS